MLRDEVDELDNRHSGFWRSLVRWLWTVKTPLKMLATEKSNLIRIVLWWTKISEAVCKRDWHNVRLYLFFNVWKFRTKFSDSVCNDLKGHCTLSLKFLYAFFRFFFVFVILSYQNACYGCENAENWTWSEFFYDGRKFRRQCVNVIDTTWGRIYFSTCENFGHSVQWPLSLQCLFSKNALKGMVNLI